MPALSAGTSALSAASTDCHDAGCKHVQEHCPAPVLLGGDCTHRRRHAHLPLRSRERVDAGGTRCVPTCAKADILSLAGGDTHIRSSVLTCSDCVCL